VGAFGTGIFHVMTHAFFKALLFLGAGSVIHGLHHEQDMRKMGGLASRMPWTHGTVLVATIAIAGIPPFAGFWSKDEILAKAFASGHYLIWGAGVLGAVMTAFYMFRLYFLTFRGEPRFDEGAGHGHDAHASHDAHGAHGGADHGHDHGHGGPVKESPWTMTGPLTVLAVLSVVGGWIGIGKPWRHEASIFETWLEPVMGHAPGVHVEHAAHLPETTEWILIAVSVLVAAIGIVLAWRTYLQDPRIATSLRERFAGVHQVLFHKYWVDELYDAIAVKPIHAGSVRLWRFWDEKIVDGTVNGVGYFVEGCSAVLRLFQTGYVGTYALFLTLGVLALFLHFLRS
jgi:NADH-quinone oxidoreductase subunit L